MSTPLIIFAKAPEPGHVKTRLIPAIGKENAVRLYCELLDCTLSEAMSSDCFPVYLYTAGNHNHPFLNEMKQKYSLIHREQQGTGLGERMYNALAEVGGGVLIGSDCPDMTADLLTQCANVLTCKDGVFLPTEDGGYALVGVKKPHKALFEGIHWSTDSVMVQTRDRLRQLNYTWKEPKVVWDLDYPEDLERYIKSRQSFTMY